MWYLVFSSSHFCGEHGLDDVLEDVGLELFVADALGVLAADDDGVDAGGLAVFVVLDGDLALAVGAQVGELAGLADGLVSWRESLWASEMGAGISSGVSLEA